MGAIMPTYNGPTVDPVAVATPRARAASPAVFGAEIVQGLDSLGEVVEKVQQRNNLETAQSFQGFIGQLNGQTEVEMQAVKGEDAFGNDANPKGKLHPMLEAYDTKVSDWIKKNDPNGNMSGYLMDKAQESRNRIEHAMLSHKQAEREKSQVNAFGAAQGIIMNTLATTAADPNRQEEYTRAHDEGIINIKAFAEAHGWSKEELNLHLTTFEQDALTTKANQIVTLNPAQGREFIKEHGETLGPDKVFRLLEMADRKEREIAGQAHDNLFQNVMVPALEQKQFIPDLTKSSDYQTMRRFNPAAALAMLKNVEEHNAGLAVDHFDQWMTGLGSGARETLTFSRVPEQIRRELKAYDPKAYNALASRFDEEQAIRSARAGAKEGNREDWAMLNLTAMTRPDLIDDSSIIAGIQSGAIPAQKGMALLTKLQKSRDVGGALRGGGVGSIINAEADALVEGIRGAENKRAAKRRIVGAVHDVLEDVFHSRSEVSPETVKNALAAMRRATVTTKGGLWSWDKQVPALLVDSDADVVTERKYREAQKYYQGQRGLTPAQAAARFSMWRALGKKTFPLIPERKQ